MIKNIPNSKASEIKLIVFDLDGVLAVPVSSWVWVHDHFGVNNDISYGKYMDNEIDDEEFMRSDIALWLSKQNRIHISEIQAILDSAPLMPGFHGLMGILRYLEITVAIVSSGLDPLAQRVAKLGKIDHVLANGLEIDSAGYLTGDGILRVKLSAKGEPVESLIEKLSVARSATVAVGNGGTDIPMLQASGLGIAFNPIDESLVETAEVVINNKNLLEIANHICDIDELPVELKFEV